MALNKNISVWRGDNTPPTDYHLWVKESGSIWIKLPGEDSWQCVGSSTSEDLANKIIEIEKVYQEQQSTIEEINNRLDTVDHGQIAVSFSNGINIYSIKGGDGYNLFGGSDIKVPALVQVKIGREDAEVNADSGELSIGSTGDLNYLLQVFYENGKYRLEKAQLPSGNISAGYGLQLSDGKMSIKIDQASSDHLSVSSDGLKLDDIPVDNISIEDIQNYF